MRTRRPITARLASPGRSVGLLVQGEPDNAVQAGEDAVDREWCQGARVELAGQEKRCCVKARAISTPQIFATPRPCLPPPTPRPPGKDRSVSPTRTAPGAELPGPLHAVRQRGGAAADLGHAGVLTAIDHRSCGSRGSASSCQPWPRFALQRLILGMLFPAQFAPLTTARSVLRRGRLNDHDISCGWHDCRRNGSDDR
jgi:hypothetical protein